MSDKLQFVDVSPGVFVLETRHSPTAFWRWFNLNGGWDGSIKISGHVCAAIDKLKFIGQVYRTRSRG